MIITETNADTTDDELDALERDIGRLEAEQAEAGRQAEAAAAEKKLEEAKQRREIEEANRAELARQQAAEEQARAEKEQQEMYDKHFAAAATYMNENKFDLAIAEYEKILTAFPGDAPVLAGIKIAQKYQNTCNEFTGRWYVEPNGIKWEVHQDKTMHGKWLVFSSDGFWECRSAREREFVTSWPDCPVCNTDYFILSDDGNTLTGIRNSTALRGRRMPEPR